MTREKRKSNNKNNQMLLLAAMIIIITAATIVIFTRLSDEEETPEEAVIDAQQLAGRWQRPDGGYLFEFSEIRNNGSLEAAYFNPNPIRIAESKWRWNGRHLQIFVQFDDVNYPGSTYDLIYLPEVDRLTGNYYQALMDQNFDVVFIRMEE
jgi:hypothetical protein